MKENETDGSIYRVYDIKQIPFSKCVDGKTLFTLILKKLKIFTSKNISVLTLNKSYLEVTGTPQFTAQSWYLSISALIIQNQRDIPLTQLVLEMKNLINGSEELVFKK